MCEDLVLHEEGFLRARKVEYDEQLINVSGSEHELGRGSTQKSEGPKEASWDTLRGKCTRCHFALTNQHHAVTTNVNPWIGYEIHHDAGADCRVKSRCQTRKSEFAAKALFWDFILCYTNRWLSTSASLQLCPFHHFKICVCGLHHSSVLM
jgi:hypothetical protein